MTRISVAGMAAIARPTSQQCLDRTCRVASIWLFVSVMVALTTTAALAASSGKSVPPHRAGGGTSATKISQAKTLQAKTPQAKTLKGKHERRGSVREAKHAEQTIGPRMLLSSDQAGAEQSAPAPQLSPDLAATKQAIDLVLQHKLNDAATLATTLSDPTAQKLVAWLMLRDGDNTAGFDAYAAFIHANSDWPSMPTLRRRAEARLWQEQRDSTTVRNFVGAKPASTYGRLALARIMLAEGNRAGAEQEVRAIWRSAELSAELETAIAKTFPDALTTADYLARMDRRIGAKDFDAAMRAAKQLGSDQVAIVKACAAAEAGSAKSLAVLEAVPVAARADLGYALCRLHWLLAHDDVAAATKLTTESSGEDLRLQDTDEWWRERRLLARRLIDLGEADSAYRVVSEAAPPDNPYYRAEFHFMSGWIALRFLDDPSTALKHFARVDEGSTDPIVLARAAYWRGRAAEAAGRYEEMLTQYRTAARYPTAYYGQLARARLGLNEISPPPVSPQTVDNARIELLHAADMLYATGEFDLVLSFVSDLGEESSDVAMISALGQLTARYHDAEAMLVIGKAALARGLPTEEYAFPRLGVPSYTPIAPAIDQCVVYSIVRTESAFDQRDMSPANAVGLMQVTPEAGRDTAKRFGVAYDWKRLLSDPVYNTQMGVAEISALFKEYAGSYVMTFAGYNAGRGRVRQWVAQHGDPRDPKVDAVDWVERIPLAETRNYVQRVMENLQVYSARLGASVATVEPNLHRTATVDWPTKPTLVDAIPQ
jgi:soluble lytic murein transglycosylase